jgi:hypothetical protein
MNMRSLVRVLMTLMVLLYLTSCALVSSGDIMREDISRPEALATIKANDPHDLLSRIRDILQNEHFSIIKSNSASIDARHLDNPDNEESAYDRVIIWLERDLNDPLQYIRVYFVWGRYEMILGSTRGIRRVFADHESPEIAAVKASILGL